MDTKTMSQFEIMDTEMLAKVEEMCFLVYWVG